MEILTGGTTMVVKFEDGRPEETVTVRIIRLRQLQEYGQLIYTGDEAGQVGLFVAKDAKWVDALTNDSAEKIVEEGQRLNADFFTRSAARKARIGELLAEKVQSKSPTTPQK